MRREPQAPRMSQPMPIDNYRLHVRFDLLERPNDQWYLPERQQTWHVRELERRLKPAHFDERKPREREHRDGRIAPLTLRGYVRPGHIPYT
jgi:hypothetical protein